MRPSYLPQKGITLCAVLASWFLGTVSAYFIITEPTASTIWLDGESNPVTWTKGLLDGITAFDVELARLSTDGLLLAAMDVPTTTNSINILLQNVPPADDYFLLFLNSTQSIMYAVSPKFTIAASSSTSNSSAPKAISGVPTLTVSGSPNPTAVFATTFPPSQNNAVSLIGSTGGVIGVMSALGACLASAAVALWW